MWSSAIDVITALRRGATAAALALLASWSAGCSSTPGGQQVVFGMTSGFALRFPTQTEEVNDVGLPLGWLHNSSSHPVRLTSVRFADPPASVHILNVYAYNYNENPHIGVIGELGVLSKECPRVYHPHPLSAAIFPPHSNGHWEVIIAFTISRPGTYHLHRVRLGYTTQGHRGWQYQNIFTTVTVKNPPLPGPLPLPKGCP